MQLPSATKPLVLYRLGPAKEKTLFKRNRDYYDGIVIPGHISSYYPKFCSEFVGSLRKPYFIDPMTYIFACPVDFLNRFLKEDGKTKRDSLGRKEKGKIKKSYQKLIALYDEPIKTIAGKRPLSAEDFSNAENLEKFVKRVIDFQKDALSEIPEKYRKYYKYIGRENEVNSKNYPFIIIPPYFYFDSARSRWFDINRRSIAIAKQIEKDLPVYPVIFTNLASLQNPTEIINGFAGADGYILWIDGFSGYSDLANLQIIKTFLNSLSAMGKNLIMLYGDSFSLVLYYLGLSGFCSGIGYGFKKTGCEPIDVEGKIPASYYIKELKKSYRLETEQRRIPLRDYPGLTCDCAICRGKVDLHNLTEEEAKEHFIFSRFSEVQELRDGFSKDDFQLRLMTAYNSYNQNPFLGPLAHLNNWASLL
jgi:hypothetical protein